MEEKKEEEKITVAQLMINDLCYRISGASIVLPLIDQYEKYLYLGMELTKEQKYMLKRDYDFTSQALMFLGRAGFNFRGLNYNLDMLGSVMDAKISTCVYDDMQKDTNDNIGLSLIYQYKIWKDPKNRKKIHDYIFNLDGEPEEDVKLLYHEFVKKSNSL